LLAIWQRAKGKERNTLLWGDEIEYLVVDIDGSDKKVRLSLRQADILAELEKTRVALEIETAANHMYVGRY
jgi:glutamate--cysteine ligase catalytic subunit